MNAERSTGQSTRLAWFKSSYSGPEGGECVEVAIAVDAVHVRDSKDVERPGLRVGTDGWARFVSFASGRGHTKV